MFLSSDRQNPSANVQSVNFQSCIVRAVIIQSRNVHPNCYFVRFYLAMHASSVCPSVCDVDVPWAYRLNWFEINYPNCNRVFAPRSHNNGNLVQGKHPQHLGGIWGRCSHQKTCNITETGQNRTKVILLMTNRKLTTRFRLVPKSMTLDEVERQFCTLFQNTCVFGAHHENLNEDRPVLSAAQM